MSIIFVYWMFYYHDLSCVVFLEIAYWSATPFFLWTSQGLLAARCLRVGGYPTIKAIEIFVLTFTSQLLFFASSLVRPSLLCGSCLALELDRARCGRDRLCASLRPCFFVTGSIFVCLTAHAINLTYWCFIQYSFQLWTISDRCYLFLAISNWHSVIGSIWAPSIRHHLRNPGRWWLDRDTLSCSTICSSPGSGKEVYSMAYLHQYTSIQYSIESIDSMLLYILF